MVEATALVIGDLALPTPHRRFARLWLQGDYAAAVAASAKNAAGGSLHGNIAASYAKAALRADVESPESFTRDDALPSAGMQVHAEYTLYGHFLHLHELLGHARPQAAFAREAAKDPRLTENEVALWQGKPARRRFVVQPPAPAVVDAGAPDFRIGQSRSDLEWSLRLPA